MKTARKKAQAPPNGLGARLREIIRGRGLTAYAVGQMAGVDPGVVQRFLTGQRDIRLETADRIASGLGLKLVDVGGRGRLGHQAIAGKRADSPGAPTIRSPLPPEEQAENRWAPPIAGRPVDTGSGEPTARPADTNDGEDDRDEA